MRTGERTIVPGDEYNYLFAKALGKNINIKEYAQLNDTLKLMKKVIVDMAPDTRAAANMLKRENAHRTCEAIWNFCFRHFQYRRDDPGVEQVRSPRRAWRDRIKGIDCDCFTVLIGSMLYNLQIPFVIRLTRYVANEFEHVYPVALIGNREVIMDCVVHKFDYQVPYKQKKDISMKLQFLNGIDDDDDDEDFGSFDEDDDDEDVGYIDLPEDAEALLLLGEDLEGLAGKAKRQEKKAARKEKREDKKEARQEKKEERKEERAEKKANRPPLKERVGKVLHVVNKVNPATALLRAGVLASMKLNVGNVAGKLRYSYWSDAQAQANNMDMAKFVQLKAIRQKIEKIFHGAGGKPENLKKSILEGNGNKDKRVSLNGLGAITAQVNDYQSLHTIVGPELYADEFANVQTVNGLGEPVSATAAIAAASGVIGTIAALIKKIGDLFKKGTPQAEKEAIQENTAAEDEKSRKFSVKNIVEKIAPLVEQYRPAASEGSTSPPVTKPDPLTQDELDAMIPPVMSDHAPDLDDYAPTDTGGGSSDLLPAVADEADVPEPTTTANEVDPTKQELDDFAPPSSNIIPNPKSGSTGSGGSGSGGAIQWVKDHPLLTAVGVLTLVAGGIAIHRAVKKNKTKTARRPALNGVDGLDGRTKRRRRRRKPGAKSTTTRRRRRSKTPAGRRRKPATKKRVSYQKVELK